MKVFKLISDILPIPSYSVIIICFFFPFLTVKCSNMELASVSGIDLALGVDFKEKVKDGEFAKKMNEYKKYTGESMDENEETTAESTEKSKPSILLIIPFVLALSGLVISFTKIRNKGTIQLIISLFGFISLVIFSLTIKNSSEINMLNSSNDGLITIHLGTAFYCASLIFVLIMSFYSFEQYWKKNYTKYVD